MTVLPRRGAAVLGSPIAHSLSPVLHNAAYAALGLDDWSYRAVECAEAGLEAMLRDLDEERLAGVSLTMPLKRAVLPLLTRVEGLARDVGGANTVLFGGVPGEWWGANTDVPGMVGALRTGGVTVLDRRGAVVIGGGATAASALAALSSLGAREVRVLARRAEAVEALRPVGLTFGVDIGFVPFDEAAVPVVAGAPVVVSTVPAGVTDDLATAVGAGGVVAGLLFDVVYAPWPTPLAAAWMRSGGRVVGGLELLVEQAALQVRLMTGQEAPVEAMRAAAAAAAGLVSGSGRYGDRRR